MLRNRIYLLFVLLSLLVSCNSYKPNEYVNKILGSDDFVKYYSDSTFSVRCTFMPKQLLAINEVNKNQELMASITQEQFEEYTKQFENGIYFRVTYGLKTNDNVLTFGVRNNQEYSQRLFYLNQPIINDFYLLDENSVNTIKPIAVNFLNNYGMTPTVDLVVVFPMVQSLNVVTLVYDDKLFGFDKKLEFSYDIRKVSRDKYKVFFKK